MGNKGCWEGGRGEYEVFPMCFLSITPRASVPRALGALRLDNGDGDKNIKKPVGLISKTTTLHVHHTFFVHFFALTARLRRENA